MPDSQDIPTSRSVLGLALFGRGRSETSSDPLIRNGREDFPQSGRMRGPARQTNEHPEAGVDFSERRISVGLPPLPQRRTQRSRGMMWSLLLCVVLPTAAVAFYFYALAADQYVAEFRFAVTEASPILPGLPAASMTTSPTAASGGTGAGLPMMGGATSLLMGESNASLQNYIVIDYLLSRQAIEELQRRINIRSLYDSADARGDIWARFGKALPMERFVRYWSRMISASYDPMSGLATVTVRAFSPADAQLIASTMVILAENLVNSIASRPQKDAVRFAESEVVRAKENLQKARDAVAAYRKKEGVIDPSGSLATNLALIQTLRAQLVQFQTNLGTIIPQQKNGNSPAVQLLKAQIAATKAQLQKVEAEVSQSGEGNPMLSDLVGKYEELDLDRQYAAGMVIAAQQALDQARANAAAQHLYLTPYVRPAMPEYALYPRRFLDTILAGVLFLGIWIVGLMVVRSVREHL